MNEEKKQPVNKGRRNFLKWAAGTTAALATGGGFYHATHKESEQSRILRTIGEEGKVDFPYTNFKQLIFRPNFDAGMDGRIREEAGMMVVPGLMAEGMYDRNFSNEMSDWWDFSRELETLPQSLKDAFAAREWRENEATLVRIDENTQPITLGVMVSDSSPQTDITTQDGRTLTCNAPEMLLYNAGKDDTLYVAVPISKSHTPAASFATTPPIITILNKHIEVDVSALTPEEVIDRYTDHGHLMQSVSREREPFVEQSKTGGEKRYRPDIILKMSAAQFATCNTSGKLGEYLEKLAEVTFPPMRMSQTIETTGTRLVVQIEDMPPLVIPANNTLRGQLNDPLREWVIQYGKEFIDPKAEQEEQAANKKAMEDWERQQRAWRETLEQEKQKQPPTNERVR